MEEYDTSNEVQRECPSQVAIQKPKRTSLSRKISPDNANSHSSPIKGVRWKDEEDDVENADDDEPISGSRWESFFSPSRSSHSNCEWEMKSEINKVSPPPTTMGGGDHLRPPPSRTDFLLPCPRRRISMDEDQLGDLLLLCNVEDIK